MGAVWAFAGAAPCPSRTSRAISCNASKDRSWMQDVLIGRGWSMSERSSSSKDRAIAPDLSVIAGKLPLKNPVLVASGTGGYGHELTPILDLTKIGGVVTKTIFREVRPGNPPQRIAETPAGML